LALGSPTNNDKPSITYQPRKKAYGNGQRKNAAKPSPGRNEEIRENNGRVNTSEKCLTRPKKLSEND